MLLYWCSTRTLKLRCDATLVCQCCYTHANTANIASMYVDINKYVFSLWLHRKSTCSDISKCIRAYSCVVHGMRPNGEKWKKKKPGFKFFLCINTSIDDFSRQVINQSVVSIAFFLSFRCYIHHYSRTTFMFCSVLSLFQTSSPHLSLSLSQSQPRFLFGVEHRWKMHFIVLV